MVLFGASYSLWAYDFSAVSPSNGYFYYNIIDEENHYVEVTYPGPNPDLPWPSSFARPEGSHFFIPTLVENDGVLYTVVAIGEYAFSWLSFQTLTLPVSVTSLGDHSLSSGITNLYYGGTLEQWMGVSIGGLVFSTNFNLYFDNVLLTDLVIPANLTEIGRSFERVNLTSVTFHNNVVSIAEYAFNGCTGLTSLSIPSSVIEIGEGAFFGCINLQQIVVDAGNSTYDSRNSCNAIIETSSNTLLFGSLGTFIPMGVTSIGQYAFAGFGLTSITIPDSVLSIGDHAFYGCRFLNTLTMPNSVTHLGESVFMDCRGLGSVVLSNALTELPDNCFSQCTYLSSIEIPTSVVSIGDHAFYDCRELRSIPIPSSVTSIGFGAFKECKTLSSIIIPNSITTIGYEAFRGCSAMYMISIPNSISSIEFSTFRNIDDLRIVICLNETPPSLANQAFPGLPNNAVLYVPSGSVTAYQNSMWTGYFSSILDYSTYNPTILSFADPVVKDICVNYYDRTNDGELDIYEIQAITSLLGFRGNTEMVSFDELQYFTGLTSISDYAFEGCTGLTSIEIPNSVTSIGNYTFQNCTGLTSVTIPNSVTSIGNYTFQNCTGLTSVTIGNSVTSIGGFVFEGCTSLTSVTIGNSVTSIGDYAFEGCTGLTSIEIPNSVTSIGNYTFQNCTGLTSVTIPNSVTSTGNHTFRNCTGLTSVTIGNSVTSIGNYTFLNCTGLTSVTIPNSVTSIGRGAFDVCTSLTSVTIPNSVTSIGDYAFEGCTGLTSIEIPNSVTSIGNYAFDGCTGLTSVTIGNSVTSTGNYTFRNCTGLTSVTIGNSVTSIGGSAFVGCTGLTSVTIPNSVTSIGESAFSGCSGLTSVTIPNSVTLIDRYAFYVCTGLTSVTIGNSVTSTGGQAFSGCSGLTELAVLAETPPSLGNDVYLYVDRSIPVYIPACGLEAYVSSSWGGFSNFVAISAGDITATSNSTEAGSVTGAGHYEAMENCTLAAVANEGYQFDYWMKGGRFYSIEPTISFTVYSDALYTAHFSVDGIVHFEDASVKSVCVSNWDTDGDGELSYVEAVRVTTLGEALRGNTSITSFDELDQFVGLASIDNYAFEGCTGLTSIEIPNSVTSISEFAFQNCTGLTTVTIPNSVTSIGNYAFAGCSGLTTVTIPNSVTSIGYDAFENCTGLTTVTIPNSVTSIGGSAFAGCTSLTSVAIGNSVTSIDGYAFAGCTGLTSVTIPNSVTSIGGYAFAGCTSLTSVAIGNSVTSIGGSAFAGCTGLISVTIPNSVTSIGNYAFQNCTGLISVTILNSVTSIGEYAFRNCTGLTTVTIPNSVTSIGQSAFASCYGLTELVVLAETPPSLGNDVYLYVDKSIPVYIPACGLEAYVSSSWGEFSNFVAMSAGDITATSNSTEAGSVTGAGHYEAMETCTLAAAANEGYQFDYWMKGGRIYSIEPTISFTVYSDALYTAHFSVDGIVHFEDASVKSVCLSNWDTDGDGELSFVEAARVTTISWVFSGNTSITSFDELDQFVGLASVDNYAFQNCTGLTSVAIPNSVTSIGGFAFQNCTGLTSVTIGNSVTSIGNYAFNDCRGLTSVTIPNSVTSIGEYAFYNCTGLTSVAIPNSVTSIGGAAFQFCTGLTSVAIPNSVTSIGGFAFNGCSGLTSVAIPNSVTSIGGSVFQNCRGLTSVAIPNSVTSIGEYAFFNCTGLTSVTIGNSVTSIGEVAFQSCTGLTRLVVLAETPPSLTESVFDFENLNNIMLYVPCNTSSLYQSASGWSGFNNYVELCPTEVTVSSDPMDGGIVSGTGTYNYGDTCTLVATPNMGYKFLNWTENDVIISSENEYKILVEEDYLLSGLHSYVAHFEAVTNHWTPVENMSGSMTFTGVIRIDGAEQANNLLELGAFCGEECRGTALPYNIDGQFIYLLNVVGNTNGEAISFRLFEHDLQQELDVYCANEVVFQDGGFEGFDELYEFNFLNSYIISAAVDPEEGGTVNGIGSYYYSTQCTLSATANENYAFDNWTLEGEMVSTESAFSFIVTGPQHYVAHFHMVNCPILLSASPEEGGTVEGEGTYLYGTSCTVGAMANVGYTFEYWTLDGQVVSNEATYTFTVNGPGEFVAHFTLNSYNVTVGAIPADAGTVAGGGIYYHGTTCTLTAIPSDGYEFNSWIKDGIIVSTDAEYSFEVTEGGDYWANFSPFTYEVNVTVNPAGAGTVTGSGSFTQGSSCTLVAQPNENFAFSRWVVNGTIVSTDSSYTFTITGDIEVEAYFDYAHSRVLTAGWTWWSTYVEQEGISGLTMLENSLGTSGIQIRDQNGYVQYMPSLNRWIGNITITNEKGYKIRVSEECTVTMTGFLANPEDHPITIVQGWNWIGYPMLQPQSVSSALSDLTPTTGDIIKGQGPFSSYYEGIGWLPEFNLEPGKSYLYYSSNEVNKTFTYANVRGGSTVAEIDNRLCDNDIVGSFDNPYQVDFRSMSGNEQTHWQSLNNFSGSVTIQGVLVINGDEYIGENIEIGAFCGDQCRGSALPYGTLVMGHRLYFISIGGDTDGELITFRLWDHDSNQELEYESQTTITFHDNDNYGQMGDWYEIEFLQDQYQYVQEVSLASGWNWWAPTVAATLQDLETALGVNGLAIMAEDGSTLNYANGLWNGTLESLVLGQMYRINTSSPCEFTFTGTKPASVQVSLARGVHWFGFTGSAPTAVGTVFGTAFGPVAGDKVVSQNGGFAIYNGTAWQGTLTTLLPGQGYVYVSQSNETKTLVME